MNRDVFLTYLDNNVSTYQNAHGYYSSGDIQYSYELSSVTDDWNDLVDILYYLNTTTDIENSIEDRIDVDMLLKGLVIESFLMGTDGYLDGHNYYFYHSNTTQKWCLFNDDFDEVFYYSSLGVPKENPDVFQYIVSAENSEYYNPLNSHVMQIEKYRNLYVQYYKTFLNVIFGSDSVQKPMIRYRAAMQFVLPWVRKDYLWQVSKGVSVEKFVHDGEFTMANLPLRYAQVFDQINNAY